MGRTHSKNFSRAGCLTRALSCAGRHAAGAGGDGADSGGVAVPAVSRPQQAHVPVHQLDRHHARRRRDGAPSPHSSVLKLSHDVPADATETVRILGKRCPSEEERKHFFTARCVSWFAPHRCSGVLTVMRRLCHARCACKCKQHSNRSVHHSEQHVFMCAAASRWHAEVLRHVMCRSGLRRKARRSLTPCATSPMRCGPRYFTRHASMTLTARMAGVLNFATSHSTPVISLLQFIYNTRCVALCHVALVRHNDVPSALQGMPHQLLMATCCNGADPHSGRRCRDWAVMHAALSWRKGQALHAAACHRCRFDCSFPVLRSNFAILPQLVKRRKNEAR